MTQTKRFFWQDWAASERNLITITLTLSAFCLVLLSWLLYADFSTLVTWDVISVLKTKQITVDIAEIQQTRFRGTEPLFYVNEHYMPSGVRLHNWPSLAWVAGSILGVSLLLTATARLSGWWFLAGIALLAAYLVGWRLEILTNQPTQWAFLIPFVLIGGFIYYQNSWVATPKAVRILVWLLSLWAIILGYLYYTYSDSQPAISLAGYGIAVGLALGAVFIFFISHEIISGLLWVTTQNKTSDGRNLLHFSVASVIYLLNALLVYLEQANRVEWSFLVVSPMVLYLISGLLGFWGLRQYFQQTQQMSYRQAGVYLYLGGWLLTSVSLLFIHATANDPWIEVTNDYLAIVHLVMGLIFFVHVLINFFQPLQQGLAVYKVVYKPAFSRLVIARVVGVFAVVAVFSLKSYYPLNQWLAGVYNARADYHLKRNDLFAAEAFYKESLRFENRQRKANYSLASLALSQHNKVQAAYYFRQSNQLFPSPHAYVGLSEMLQQENLFFDALFTLQEGLKKFPDNPFLATNLAGLYASAKNLDSSFIYLTKAHTNCHDCSLTATNLAAFWLEHGRTEVLDSVVNALGSHATTSFAANRAAMEKLQNKIPQVSEKWVNPAVKSLNSSQFVYLYNTITAAKTSTPWPDSTLRNWQFSPENAGYFDDILYLRGKQAYTTGNKLDAIKHLDYLAGDTLKDTRPIAQTLGIWLLQEGIRDKALRYFQRAGDTATTRFVETQILPEDLQAIQQAQAAKFLKEPISLSNYKAVYGRAPFNPFVLDKLVASLNSLKKEREAYDLLFESLQTQTKEPRLWQLYARQALRVGLPEYARDGLVQLQPLLPAAEYEAFRQEIEAAIAKRAAAQAAF